MKKLLLYTFLFLTYVISSLFAENEECLHQYASSFSKINSTTIEAIDDFISITIGESITIPVLENDAGSGIELKKIMPPNCGGAWVFPNDKKNIHYASNAFSGCLKDSIEYEITDTCGISDTAWVFIELNPNLEFNVQVERDCTNADQFGIYALNMAIWGGVPPFIISGSINDTLESPAIVVEEIEDGLPYEIFVTDAAGSEFHETGGQIACAPCPNQQFAIESIGEVAECLCNGDLIFTFAGFQQLAEITFIEGYWHNATFSKPIELNDTIPADATVELYGFDTEDHCYYIIYEQNYFFNYKVSDLCSIPCIEANSDLITTFPTESITFNVLENDIGEGIFIKQIAKPPFCGTVKIIDAAMGILQYTPDESCSLNLLSFDYQIEDSAGSLAVGTVKVVINVDESDLVVAVERDCCAGNSWIDLYPLTVYIVEGVPPFVVSGTTNLILDSVGIVSYGISGYEPYEITVEDAAGNEFFAEGGEIACDKLCSEIELYTDFVVEEGFLDCLCNGSLIVSFTPLAKHEEVQSIYGFWYLDNQPHSIEWGDTIPNNAYFEIFEVQTDYANYFVSTEEEDFLGGYASEFCPTPCIETHADITTTSPTESTTFNVLENDLGEEIFIKDITNHPLCGSVEIIDAAMGEIRYTPDYGCLLEVINFEYEIEDIEGNTAKAIVKVVMNENDLVVGIEIDYTGNETTGDYSLTVTIAEGVVPFTITGSINGIIEETGVYESVLYGVNPFEVSILDAAENEFFQMGEAIACHTLGGQIDVYHIEQLGDCLCDGSFVVDLEELEMGFEFEEINGFWLDKNGEKIELELGDTIPANSFFELSSNEGSLFVIDKIRGYPQGFTSDFCTPQIPPPSPTLNESESQTSTCDEPITLSLEEGEEGTTFHWYLDADGTIPANPPTGQVWTNDELIGIDTIYVIAMDANACQSEALEIEATRWEELKVENLTQDFRLPECEEYKVSFTILGGNGDYIVNGAPSSDDYEDTEWRESGSSYYFEVDDNNETFSCPAIIEEGTPPSVYCIPIIVIDDFALVTVGDTVEISVFQNDEGSGVFLSDILIDPMCGEIIDINPEWGIITYVPYDNTECTEDSFVYEATDLGGVTASATVTVFITNCVDLQIAPFYNCLITETQDSIALLTYQITGGDGNYTFNGNPQNDTLQNGDIYQIDVTDGNGCTASISDTISCHFTSIENPNLHFPNIQLFPNPNKGNFTLTLQLQQAEQVDIEVFDVMGKAKIRRRLKNTATFERHDFNLDLNTGLYFIRVSGKDWIWTEKMVVR